MLKTDDVNDLQCIDNKKKRMVLNGCVFKLDLSEDAACVILVIRWLISVDKLHLRIYKGIS